MGSLQHRLAVAVGNATEYWERQIDTKDFEIKQLRDENARLKHSYDQLSADHRELRSVKTDVQLRTAAKMREHRGTERGAVLQLRQYVQNPALRSWRKRKRETREMAVQTK